VEFATVNWVDWFNNRRLLEPIGYNPSAEFEAVYPNAQMTSPIRARVIYVVISEGPDRRLCRGEVFSYYEFKWPLNDRLTDEAWQENGGCRRTAGSSDMDQKLYGLVTCGSGTYVPGRK